MDIQKQLAFEKFHAHECNCDYEELKRRLDRHELLTGHRYPPTSPRHEAWLTWCAAWDAKTQAVPEGFVLVCKSSISEAVEKIEQLFEEDSLLALGELLPIQQGLKTMIEAQEQGHE